METDVWQHSFKALMCEMDNDWQKVESSLLPVNASENSASMLVLFALCGRLHFTHTKLLFTHTFFLPRTLPNRSLHLCAFTSSPSLDYFIPLMETTETMAAGSGAIAITVKVTASQTFDFNVCPNDTGDFVERMVLRKMTEEGLKLTAMEVVGATSAVVWVSVGDDIASDTVKGT
jgi:hypothetical protein